MEKKSTKALDGYFDKFPPSIRKILENIRNLIRKQVPEAEEIMAYGVPTFRHHGNLIHYAAFKKHIGIYPSPTVITHFARELEPYSTSRGTVRFPLSQPIPYDLIERMVAYRLSGQLGPESGEEP